MTQTLEKASVSVDGDKLAEALRRVTQFMAETPEHLAAVYLESDGQNLELTTTDGVRMAHLTTSLPFPAGKFLMKGSEVKDFAFRHFNGAQIEVLQDEASIKLGDVTVPLLTHEYPNYPDLIPQTFEFEAVVDTRKWTKAIRGSGAHRVGVVYNAAGCRMYSQNKEGETIGCEPLPFQMASGPEIKVAYNADYFRRALASCGPTATIQVQDPGKPTLFESEDYWHILAPGETFPKEVSLTENEREALKLAEEVFKSVRLGDVMGKVMVGGNKFYLELDPQIKVTQVLMQQPVLKAAEEKEGGEKPA